MEIAKIQVNATSGLCLSHRRIPAGLVGGTVQVTFLDPVWDKLTKTVVFRSTEKKIAEFDGTTAVVPWELLEQGQWLYFGIWGSDSASDLQVPLIEVPIGVVEKATEPNADPATDPTLTVWADLKNRVEDLEECLANGVTVSGATVGQTVKISAVDAEGKPTVWEAADFPKLDGDMVTEAVEDALTTAKESGEFDGPAGPQGEKGDKGDKGDTGAQGDTGPAGKTPVKGTDYYTETDKQEMVSLVLAALPVWEGGSY